jgi:ABC-type Fe3+/spermidine/putrescine transport system ATPase subunit
MRLSSSKEGVGEFKSLDGGHVIHLAVKHEELAPLNKPCILAIRPEHIELSNNGAPPENGIAAQVTEITFAGPTSTIKLDANGLRLEALELASYPISVGDQCIAVLPSQRISLLKE